MKVDSISTVGTNKYPTPEILALLRQYNLEPTGSITSDLAAIEKAKSKQAENVGRTSDSQKPAPETPPAVAEFMQKLGLTPTNSKEGDLEAITNKLSEMEASAKTDSERQNVANLRAEFSAITASLGSAGQAQTGTLNKFFMLN